MNKKVLTLCAGFLLAGGLFSTANAMKLSEATPGKFYHLQQVAMWNGNGNWAYLTGENLNYYMSVDTDGKTIFSTTAKDEWTVETKTEAGVTYYALKNQDGKYFTVMAGETPITSFVMNNPLATNEAGQDANHLTFKINGVETYIGATQRSTTVIFDVTATTEQARAFDLVEIDANVVSASELNAYLGSTAGFKIQIGNLAKANDDNSFVAYTNLSEGNQFDGI